RLAAVLADDEGALPEAEGAMLLECSHAAHHALVQEVRRAPLQGLLDLRTGGVHDLANVLENGLGEIGRPGDIRVDAGVSGCHVYLGDPWVREWMRRLGALA